MDQSTLYVTTLRYDGKLPDVQFRASNSFSNTSGPLLFVGNDSADELHAYWGQNVYFKLPDNITIYEIEYIHVWSRIAGVVYGNIAIPSNIKVPDKRSTEDVSCCSPVILLFLQQTFLAKWQKANMAP